MEPKAADTLNQTWSEGTWHDIKILCEAVDRDNGKGFTGFGDDFYSRDPTLPSVLICNIAIIMGVSCFTLLLLKPLRMPFTSQMIGGVIMMGVLFSKKDFQRHAFLTPSVIFILKTISNIGFIFQLVTSGLETNMVALVRRVDIKAVVICFTGTLTSIVFGSVAYALTCENDFTILNLFPPSGISSLITINAETFFMVTCNNLNDLGISNSDIGRLASCISLIVDLLMMGINFFFFIMLRPFTSTNKDEIMRSFVVMGYYLAIFFVCRPLVLYTVSLIPKGKAIKKTHFMFIFLIILIIAGIGEILDEMFAVFLFALSLPEHPLASIFFEKMDAIVSAVFFPVYCATLGLQTNIYAITKSSARIEFILVLGYVGKFLGISCSSRWFDVPFWNSLALALILCSKGILDLVSLGIWRQKNVLNIEEYTLGMFHFLICTLALMPLVRLFYEPSSQYAPSFRRSVCESTKNGTCQTLACIYKEENLPGTIRLMEAFRPTKPRSIPCFALQLMPLTGRCTLPIKAPFDQAKTSATFRTKLSYSTRIVEAFSNLERKGNSHLNHHIAMSSYESMHNDICSLAYERRVSLIILPFHKHLQWTKVGKINDDSSKSEREVNKMVLEKAPCSVAMLLDRGNPHEGIPDTSIYQVAIIFIGGADDKEALAFTRMFGNHPNVKVTVFWLKSTVKDRKEASYHDTIMSFQGTNKQNEKLMTLREVIVNDGLDTTNVFLAMNGAADLVIVGRQHDRNFAPLHGLSLDGLYEYPELGILGDLLATPDFGFSVLVVQQEPRKGNQLRLDSRKSGNNLSASNDYNDKSL